MSKLTHRGMVAYGSNMDLRTAEVWLRETPKLWIDQFHRRWKKVDGRLQFGGWQYVQTRQLQLDTIKPL
jgi:hypothetical protein